MSKTKIVYSYDEETFKYNGEALAQESPLEVGNFLMPANSTTIKPILKEGKIAKFDKSKNKWVYEDITKPEPEPKPEPTQEEIIKELKLNLINSRLSYLSSTDWYITREFDKPNSYPQEIKDKRNLIRDEINEIEQINNLDQLNNYKIDI